MLLIISELKPKSIKDELQNTELLKAVPSLASMKMAVSILGVLNTTNVNPNSLIKKNAPFLSFFEAFLTVIADRQNTTILKP